MAKLATSSIRVNPYAAGGLFGQYKIMLKALKFTENLTNGYSFESTERELSNEYQHDRVRMVFKDFYVFVLRTKVASALEGLMVTMPGSQG